MLKRHTHNWRKIKYDPSNKLNEHKKAIQGFKNEWNNQAKKCMEEGVEIPAIDYQDKKMADDVRITELLVMEYERPNLDDGNGFVSMVPEVKIDFCNMTFGKVNFKDTVFNVKAKHNNIYISFDGSTFIGHACFDGVTFEASVYFEGVTFSKNTHETKSNGDVQFKHVKFKNYVTFQRAVFHQDVLFYKCEFNEDVLFYNARLMAESNFSNLKFSSQHTLCFDHVKINDRLCFQNTDFYSVNFNGINIIDISNVREELSQNREIFETNYCGVIIDQTYYEIKAATFNEKYATLSLSEDKKIEFKSCIYETATFDEKKLKQGQYFFVYRGFDKGKIEFNQVNFLNRVDFLGCYLHSSRFNNATFIHRFKFVDNKVGNLFCDSVFFNIFLIDSNIDERPDFSKAIISGSGIVIDRDSWREQPKDPNSLNEGAYRWLKNYYNQQNDHEREQEYFALEMEAIYKNLSSGTHKFVFCFYKLFSNYGTSYKRPLVTLGGIFLLYWLIEDCYSKPYWANEFNIKVIFPFIQTGKPIDGPLEVLISIFSPIFLFLFGLGIRSRFKLR
tara:strand:+ start:1997 stop:3673 length:1677 start_codon:yes stop_codon:yes gene_type:complete